MLDDVAGVVDTPGGTAAMVCWVVVTPSVAAGGCNPPATAMPPGGCSIGAGKGSAPEVGGNIAPGGLMPGIMATNIIE